MPVTVIYSQEPHLGEPPDLPVKAKLQSPESGNQSEIKIVQVWSMAVEKDSDSVDNSQQHSNLMEQASQIIPADNSSNNDVSQTVQTQESPVHSETVAIEMNWEGRAHINKYVSNSSEKTTDNKATRLERQRERRRERYQTDPVYAERQRERQRRSKKQSCQSVNSAKTQVISRWPLIQLKRPRVPEKIQKVLPLAFQLSSWRNTGIDAFIGLAVSIE